MNSPPRKRITPDERLRGRDTIHRVFEVGLSARRGRVIARFVFADEREVALRFGVTVTRKIPTAVLRNRCKRLLREAVREHKGDCAARLREHHRSADVMFIWMDPKITRSMDLLSEISLSVRDLLGAIAGATPVTHEDPSPRAH